MGGTEDSELVQIRTFLPVYFSPLQVTSIPSTPFEVQPRLQLQ